MKNLTFNKSGSVQVAIGILSNLVSNEVCKSFALDVSETTYQKPSAISSKLPLLNTGIMR